MPTATDPTVPRPYHRSQRSILAGSRADTAAFAFHFAAWRLRLALRRFDPNQPRVPAGSPGGGQRTDGHGNTDVSPTRSERVLLAQAGGGARPMYRPLRIDALEFQIGLGQAARINQLQVQLRDVVARIRAIDPVWRSRQGLYSTPNGYEADLIARRNEAERYYEEKVVARHRENLLLSGRTTEEILKPDGGWLGFSERGAGRDVRTLSGSVFDRTVYELFRRAEPVPAPPGLCRWVVHDARSSEARLQA